MAHMTHRQRQAAAKAEKAAQIPFDARRIEWENRVYDADREMHRARTSTDAANQAGGPNALSTFWYTVIFVGVVLWVMQDDPNPTLIHCIGDFYQPITTTNINDCRR